MQKLNTQIWFPKLSVWQTNWIKSYCTGSQRTVGTEKWKILQVTLNHAKLKRDVTLKQEFLLSLKLPSLFLQITGYITWIYSVKILYVCCFRTRAISKHLSLMSWTFSHETIKQKKKFHRMYFWFIQEVLITHFLTSQHDLANFLKTKHLGSWYLRLEGEYQMTPVYCILAHPSECISSRSLLFPVHMALTHVSQ